MNVYSVTDAQGNILGKDDINELLKDMGISDDAIEEGTESAIEEDAEQNDVNLNNLSTLAQKENAVSGSADKAQETYQQELTSIGIPSSVISQGEDAIETYASSNGITLPSSTGTSLNIKS